MPLLRFQQSVRRDVCTCFFVLLLVVHLSVTGAEWSPSSNLSMWYPDWEICTIRNNTAMNIHEWRIVANQYCNSTIGKNHHCFAGGEYQSRYCHTGRPLSSYILSSFDADTDSTNYMLKLIHAMKERDGAMYLDGDSQMTNLRQGMYCDLYRQNLQTFHWGKELQSFELDGHKISFSGSAKTDMNFDWNATKTMEMIVAGMASQFASGHKYLLLVIGLGTHYNIWQRGQTRYREKLELMLPFWNNIPILFPNHTVDVVFMETAPQHFNTTNGYFGRKLTKCVPLHDRSPAADWRNVMVREVIEERNLTRIHMLSTRYMKNLYTEHCIGDYHDCTHYAWWPMLYQPMYRQLYRIVTRKRPAQASK